MNRAEARARRATGVEQCMSTLLSESNVNSRNTVSGTKRSCREATTIDGVTCRLFQGAMMPLERKRSPDYRGTWAPGRSRPGRPSMKQVQCRCGCPHRRTILPSKLSCEPVPSHPSNQNTTLNNIHQTPSHSRHLEGRHPHISTYTSLLTHLYLHISTYTSLLTQLYLCIYTYASIPSHTYTQTLLPKQ